MVGSCFSQLHWDLSVLMPRKGGRQRAKQMGLLSEITHHKRSNPQIGDLITACDARVLDAELAANVRKIEYEYKKLRKLSPQLVKTIAIKAGEAEQAWIAARESGNDDAYLRLLTEMIELQREKAACLGWETDGEMWDALADEYEPGCSAKWIEQVFGDMEKRLRELLKNCEKQAAEDDYQLAMPIEEQKHLVRQIADAMGFDFERGRIDESAHPFCTEMGRDDVRLTSRYEVDDCSCGILGAIHELGHALYEQGLRENAWGLPTGLAASFGIHEAMARLWENMVGRGEAFCDWLNDAHGLSGQAWFRQVNRVQAGAIRVDADEVSYNLHVMVRFDLERQLLNGELTMKDLPEAWREMYWEKLGVEITDDREGYLQDIHWACGGFGYFQCYTLGSIYAAQLYAKIRDADDAVRCGDFEQIRAWLNEHVYQYGQQYKADELCERATGSGLDVRCYLDYLEGKFHSK
ncbi:Thermostable carboxypeptidase 1 [Poriferisphaera corsica]|uniref:Metal-dependent carboxypeptidase n=2 Tax=Poriferisphaera corsica TaxID=2528020 RepID=A0A517YS95_9BACT|nr:Thermostable carboxypeptidase 1 [Poriferisphaera corsica]